MKLHGRTLCAPTTQLPAFSQRKGVTRKVVTPAKALMFRCYIINSRCFFRSGIQQAFLRDCKRVFMRGFHLVDHAGRGAGRQIAQTRGGRAAGIRVVRGFGHQITKPHGQLRAVRKRQNRRHIRRIQPVGGPLPAW